MSPFSHDGYATPVRSSASPNAFCSSDAPDVPISSSPGGYEAHTSSQSSIRSFYCAYSVSSSSESNSGEHGATTGSPFTEELRARLAVVAAHQRGEEHSAHSGEPECDSGNVTPNSYQFRIIKRALTRDNSFQAAKYRRVQGSAVVATEPATPVPTRQWSTSVPSIAPPEFYVPRLPLKPETEAKIRLGKYLEREGNERIRDGLIRPPTTLELGDLQDRFEHSQCADGWNSVDWERALGIDNELRIQAIDWITRVVPKHASGRYTEGHADSRAGSANSSFESTSSTTSYPELSDLYDQLVSCPKTRFHAVWLFLRYFWITSPERGQAHLPRLVPASDDPDFEIALWDTALACLAISVKFHRDFLIPLCPIRSQDFLSLASHDVCYGELEAAQRDVLQVISHSVGGSPQAILDELWNAVPSLRQLFAYDGGWNALQKEVWFRLFDVIYAPDVLRFPQSRLVSVALIDSLVHCLAARYEYQAGWHVKAVRRPRDQNAEKKVAARFAKRAFQDAEGTILDIQAVVGITDAQLAECRAWWSRGVSIIEES